MKRLPTSPRVLGFCAALALGLTGCTSQIDTDTGTTTTSEGPEGPQGPLDPFAKLLPASWLTAVAARPDDGMYLAGTFDGELDLGDGPLTAMPGAPSVFLARLDSRAKHVWSGTPGGLTFAGAESAAITPDGGLVTSGWFSGSLDLGSGVLQGSSDQGFVASFAADSTPLFSFALGGVSFDYANDMVVSAEGNIAVGLQLGSGADLGGGSPDPFIAGSQYAVALFDPQGDYLWDRRIEAGELEWGDRVRVAAAPDGAVFFAGSSKVGVTFGAQSVGPGGFVGKIGANGEPLWLVGSDVVLQMIQIVADSKGDVVIGGVYQTPGTSLFGEPVPEALGTDLFLAKLTGDGETAFVKALVTEGNELSFALALAPDDAILAATTLYGPVSFGGETFEGVGADGFGFCNVCVARFSAAAEHEASTCWGGEEVNSASVVHVSQDSKGQALIAGQVGGPLSFGEVHLDADEVKGEQVFIARVPY